MYILYTHSNINYDIHIKSLAYVVPSCPSPALLHSAARRRPVALDGFGWQVMVVGFGFLFSPPARRLLDFKIALCAFSSFSSSPPCQLLIAVGTAGPQLPAPASSRSQWRRWTSTTISRYQWALPGPLESSGHAWTSTGDLPSPVGTAGPQPEPPEPSGHCWTSTTR